MKKVVLFDIDYVLFNTKRFREGINRSVSEVLSIDIATLEKEGAEIIEQVRKETGFNDPELFIPRFLKKLKREKEEKVIRKRVFEDYNFEEDLYKEIKSTVEQLAKKSLVGILSRGSDLLQRAKISAIKHFFDDQHIHIVASKEEKLPEIVKKYRSRKLYLIDDALGVLYLAKKLNKNIFAVWVKRGRFARVQKPIPGFKPDAEVTNLSKVVQLITNN